MLDVRCGGFAALYNHGYENMQQDNIAIKVKGLRKDFDISESGKGFSGKLKALFHRRHKILSAVRSRESESKPRELVASLCESGSGN